MPVRRRNAYGVTLIELMVTLAVAAILITLAAPSLVTYIDKNRVKGVAEGVASVLNNARSESVKRGRDINVKFSGTTTAWCVGANSAVDPTPGATVPAAQECDCTASTDCQVGGQRQVFETTDTQAVSINALPSSVTFDGRLGTLPLVSNLPTVTFTSPRGRFDLQLKMTPLGQVSMCVPSGKPAIAGYASC